MTLILKQIFAFLKVLNSDTGENQIAAGLACGLVLGFAPALSLQTIFIFIVIFFFRIQAGAAFTAAFFFSFIAWAFDPILHQIGSMALELESMRSFYTTLFNLPIIPFTKFYNSVVMGSAIASILMAPIVFIIAKILIKKYRIVIMSRFEKTKAWKAVKATALYKWYAKYDQLYGA